jgi:hypothetical protein
MDILTRLTGVVRNPPKFFTQIRKEGFKESFLLYVVFSIINVFFSASLLQRYLPLGFHWRYLILLIILLVTFFIVTALIHLSIKILRGQGRYIETAKGYIYGAMPSLLWSIPQGFLQMIFGFNLLLILIGIAVYIYSFFLTVIGLSVLHKISRGRVFLGFLLPLIAVVGLIVVVMIVAFLVTLTKMLG